MNTDRDRLTPRLRRATITAVATDSVDVSYQGADGVPVGWVGDRPDIGDEVSVLQAKGTGLVVGRINLDVWHTVGDPGEPAFAGNWGVSGTSRHPGFRLSSGRVELSGVAGNTVAVAPTSTIFTLPAGYRPNVDTRFGCCGIQAAGNAIGVSIFVFATGVVSVGSYASTVQWGAMPLEGLSFPIVGPT